ncbi:MAG TPA: hypothetical protein VJ302_23345 [Blastocatellia bacterium]|nr:hypothetical protein [Blastocatellia bacterium]
MARSLFRNLLSVALLAAVTASSTFAAESASVVLKSSSISNLAPQFGTKPRPKPPNPPKPNPKFDQKLRPKKPAPSFGKKPGFKPPYLPKPNPKLTKRR